MSKKLATYEMKYKELEKILQKLEDESVPLESMMEEYKQGLTLVKECADILKSTEENMQQIIEEVKIKESDF